MKPSGIGGQAVLEGVMMKNKDKYAVAVRKPDGEIDVDVQDYKGIGGDSKIAKLPFIWSWTMPIGYLMHKKDIKNYRTS